MSDLTWIAVPGGIGPSGEATLRVLVVPHLDPGTTPGGSGMDPWPPAALATDSLLVEFADEPDAQVQSVVQAVPRVATREGAWQAFFGAVQTVREPVFPSRRLEIDPTSSHIARIKDTYRDSAKAMRTPESHPDFHRAVRTQLDDYRNDEEPAPRTGTQMAQPPPTDFHRTLSLLREHPTVLRALGLVFDLVFPRTHLSNFRTGLIRVSWEARPAALPTIKSPWTSYTSANFLPAPAEVSDLASGMVALGRPEWELHTIDADSALGRLRDAARSDDQGPATLPALRTAGVMLVRAGRQAALKAHQDLVAGQSLARPLALNADHLLLGYRVDVRVFGADQWLSLCRRMATYEVGNVSIANELSEEGHIKVRSGVDHGDGVFSADEVVARWDGWSLAAPRFPRADRGPANGFRKTLQAEPGTLPKLRFGTTYQLRARVADIAGGGRPLSDPSPDGSDSKAILFTRHEPIAAPGVRFPDGLGAADLGPGGALDLLVVRTGEGVPERPADATRVIEPPRTTIEVVERHGKLEGDIDQVLSLVNRDGLVDPAAGGVAVFLRPDPGGPVADLETREWEEREQWPDLGPKNMFLRVRQAKEPTLDWMGNDDLFVRLSPAEQVVLEVSSYLTAAQPNPMLASFAINEWLPRSNNQGDDSDQAVAAVVTGRHPMVTPARVITLVHAVRTPLRVPSGTFTPRREAGQGFAVLEPQSDPHTTGNEPHPPAPLNVDAASTATLEVSAAWIEVDDQGEHPIAGVPVQIVGVARGPQELPKITHEFGDTRHRRVTYTLTAVSRCRAFFDASDPEKDFRAVGSTPEVRIPSSARPVPPIVLSAVPAFTWTESKAGGVVTRRRLAGRIRVELARPWFTTGVGEQLAVLVPLHTDPPQELWPYLTQMGRDPIFSTPEPPRWPALGGTQVRLSEKDAAVMAIGHDVWSFGGSWYADIALPATSSYSPMVQLAVARYQPESIAGLNLEVSAVVRTDFVPLMPERTLTVDTSRPDEVQVTLQGVGPEAPSERNRVHVVLEHCVDQTGLSLDPETSLPPGSAEVIAFEPTDGSASAWVSIKSVRGLLGQFFSLVLPAERPLRVRVREVEVIDVDLEAPLGQAGELRERVVFTDIVPLTGA